MRMIGVVLAVSLLLRRLRRSRQSLLEVAMRARLGGKWEGSDESRGGSLLEPRPRRLHLGWGLPGTQGLPGPQRGALRGEDETVRVEEIRDEDGVERDRIVLGRSCGSVPLLRLDRDIMGGAKLVGTDGGGAAV